MAMTVDQLRQRAEAKGYTLHQSVTAERMDRINDAIMLGNAVRLTDARALSRAGIEIENADQLDREGCVLVPYRIGTIGEQVVAPPKLDKDLMLVTLPSYTVVGYVEGAGESFDGDDTRRLDSLIYTILRPGK